MRVLSSIAGVLCLCLTFNINAQEQSAKSISNEAVKSPEAKQGTVIPNITGKYMGTFQNKISRLSLMGLEITIKDQNEKGEISGELIQYVGSCRGVPMKLTGNIDAKGKAQMQAIGNCPQKLEVQISGSSMIGDMYGANPYEVSLKK